MDFSPFNSGGVRVHSVGVCFLLVRAPRFYTGYVLKDLVEVCFLDYLFDVMIKVLQDALFVRGIQIRVAESLKYIQLFFLHINPCFLFFLYRI